MPCAAAGSRRAECVISVAKADVASRSVARCMHCSSATLHVAALDLCDGSARAHAPVRVQILVRPLTLRARRSWQSGHTTCVHRRQGVAFGVRRPLRKTA
nr:MAG: hypothetical protein DIU56_11400 [Pseudomonadota bacterium]